MHQLEGSLAPGADLLGLENLAHAAASERANELEIRAYDVVGAEWHSSALRLLLGNAERSTDNRAVKYCPRLALLVLGLVGSVGCGEDPPKSAGSVASATSASVSSAKASTAASTTASAAAAEPPSEIRIQHVLIAYKGAKDAAKTTQRSKEDAKKLAEEVRKKAIEGADFAELAKQHSDDEGSRERLGSLGKVKRETLVKPVADAAFALSVDAISEVVESPYGFHVIKRNQ